MPNFKRREICPRDVAAYLKLSWKRNSSIVLFISLFWGTLLTKWRIWNFIEANVGGIQQDLRTFARLCFTASWFSQSCDYSCYNWRLLDSGLKRYKSSFDKIFLTDSVLHRLNSKTSKFNRFHRRTEKQEKIFLLLELSSTFNIVAQTLETMFLISVKIIPSMTGLMFSVR